MALTAEGRAFRREAEKILRQVAESTVRVQTIASGYERTIRLGCHGSLCHRELVEGLRALHRARPELRVLLFQDIAMRLAESLRGKELDCVLATWFPEVKVAAPWADWQILREESVRLMVAADHPLAGRETVTMAEIAREPVILLSGSDKRDHLMRWADSGHPIRVYCYAEDTGSVETMVAAGFGVSLCLESACRARPDLCYPAVEGLRKEKVALYWKKGEAGRAMAGELLSLFSMDASKPVI